MGNENEQSVYDEFEQDGDMNLLGGDFDEPAKEEPPVDNGDGVEQKDTVDGQDGVGSPKESTPDGQPSPPDNGQEPGTEEGKEQEPQRDPVIPRARFDEVNKRLQDERRNNEALEARVRELEGRDQQAQQPQPQDETVNKHEEEVDIADLERQWQEAILDDEGDRALELRMQINAEIRRQAREEALDTYGEQETARQRKSSAEQAQKLLDQTANEIAGAYPELNMAAATGNQEKVDEVVDWRNFLITSKGMAPHEALREAAKRVLGEPRVVDKDKFIDPRTNDAVQRGLKDSDNQPPTNQDGLGVRATGVGYPVPDDQDAWDKTPDKEREKLLQ